MQNHPFNLKISIFICLFLFLFISFNLFRINNFKKAENYKLILQLDKCFDLKNKNTRRNYESLKLVEYCMKKYGSLK